jgi:addiction module RelE/StbE family toxin
VKLEWSAFALSDREGIFDYIEADSPRSAIRVDEAIANAAERLINFPESGRPGRITGTRELVLAGLPYILAYIVRDNVVRMLCVIHGAQQWPDALPH